MYLARLIAGSSPMVTEVDDHELYLDATCVYRKRPRQPRAWLINGGAAAISQSPAGAVASAKFVIYQRAHIA